MWTFADCQTSGPVRLTFTQLHGTAQSRKDCISTFISDRFDTLWWRMPPYFALSLPSTLWKGKNKSSLSNCHLLLSLPHYLFWKVVAKPTALKQSIYLNETVCVLWSSKSSATLREWRLKISGVFSHKLSAMYFFFKRFHSLTRMFLPFGI